MTHIITPTAWGVLGIFFLIPITFITNLLSKHFVNKIGRRYIKDAQRNLFTKLLSSQMIEQNDIRLSQILNSMMDNNITGKLTKRREEFVFYLWLTTFFISVFQVRAATLYIWSVIVFSFLLSILANGFVFFFVLLPIVEFWLRFKWYFRTIEHYGEMEIETRQKLLHLVANQLKGRIVIQSFDSVQKFRAKYWSNWLAVFIIQCNLRLFFYRIYNAIEENSTAFYIRRSASYYNQFRLNLQQGLFTNTIDKFDGFK